MSEYAYQLVGELDKLDKIDALTVLADVDAPSVERLGRKTRVQRVWKPDSSLSILLIPFRLLKLKPDVVHFNCHFFSMGNKRTANLAGLCLIPLCRLLGLKVVTTFHHLGIDGQDLGELGVKRSFLNRLGISVGYFLVYKSNVVVSHVKNQVRRRNTVYIPHGATPQKEVDFGEGYDPKVVFFGALSPYKGVEYLIQAFNKLNRPDLKLVITNSPHPRFPDHAGKLKNLARNGNITFVDYVLEEDLPAFFSNSSIVVFPYTLTTGTSGAFHTAASYGKATIMSDLPLFRELIEEGAGGLLFPAKDADSLADQISCLVSDPDQARKIGKQNLDFAKSRAWNIVARKYLLVYRHVVDRNWEGFGFQVEPRQNVQIECWV